MYKSIVSVAAIFVLAACSSAPEKNVTSTNPDVLYVGENPPPGYPKTYTERSGNHCIKVTESWRRDEAHDTTIWLKNVRRLSGDCVNVELNEGA